MKEKISNILSRNTVITIFLILTLTILGLEYILYQFERNRLIEEEQKFLRFVAEKEEKNLSEWYVDTKISVEVLSKSENFKSLLTSFLKNPNDFRTRTLLDDFFKNEVVDKKLVTVIIYDTSFNRIYS